ncbi:Homeobox protein SEBOX [Plecturocebus cupreus]
MALWLLTLCQLRGQLYGYIHSRLGPHQRKRTAFSKGQLLELEGVFAAWPYPDISTCERLAWVTHLPEAKIQTSCVVPEPAKRIKNRKHPPAALGSPNAGPSPSSGTLQRTSVCRHTCPAPSLGPWQGWEGAKAVAPWELAGASGVHPSLEQATPQTSPGSLSDLIYASAIVTNVDHS